MNEACSTEVTPALIARLMPSVPCACAATRFSHMCASSTSALSSSCENWGAPTDSSSDSTPAVAATLITSAPYLTSVRTSFRISSTPSAMLLSPLIVRYGENPDMSPCPPVALTASVATCIRGPAISPRLIALRIATSTSSPAPTSRTVVNPASSVRRA